MGETRNFEGRFRRLAAAAASFLIHPSHQEDGIVQRHPVHTTSAAKIQEGTTVLGLASLSDSLPLPRTSASFRADRTYLARTNHLLCPQPGNFSYDSPMKCFLEAIREQRLPTDLLDVLDEAGVRYYEGRREVPLLHTLHAADDQLLGCLIVEVHDHRSTPPPVPQRQGLTLSFQLNNIREAPPPSKAEIYRIVLGPNPATLWTDLGIVEKRWAAEKEEDGDEEPGWTEDTAVELEAIILVSYFSLVVPNDSG